MLDIKFIRENIDKTKDILKKRNVSFDIEHILALDAKRSSLQQKIQLLREERNKISKTNTEQTRKRGKEIKEELKILDPEFETIQSELKDLLKKLPNSLHPKTPIGKDESENVVLREHGQKPKFQFKPKDHIEIGKKLDLIDFEKAAKVTGSGFYYFKNQMVIMEMAILRYGLDFLREKGFKLFLTPDLAKINILEGIGFQPKGPEAQVYTVSGTDLGLIGTAEITMGGYHSGEILSEKDLPLKYAAISHCFRTEAGGYGRESRGLYRVHQFSKVEMFIYCLPNQSDSMHDYLVSLEEEIYKNLNLPYRVIDICSGDLGAPAYRKFDIEVYMPGMEKWGEVTSTSNCTDYQARKLMVKYRMKDGNSDFLHMLNGTAVTTSRLPIAILENFQQEDGSVKIPKALQKYTGFDKIEPHGV